jgi:hypothetical protein
MVLTQLDDKIRLERKEQVFSDLYVGGLRRKA